MTRPASNVARPLRATPPGPLQSSWVQSSSRGLSNSACCDGFSPGNKGESSGTPRQGGQRSGFPDYLTASACVAALPVAAWLLYASPAHPAVTLTEPGEDDGSVAWIVHDNQQTIGNGADREAPFALDMPEGPITGTEVSTPNGACVPGCPDTVTILDVPPGLAVVPSEVVTPEFGRSVIKVFQAVGF